MSFVLLAEDGIFVYKNHDPVESKDYLYAYRLSDQQCLAYRIEYTERKFKE